MLLKNTRVRSPKELGARNPRDKRLHLQADGGNSTTLSFKQDGSRADKGVQDADCVLGFGVLDHLVDPRSRKAGRIPEPPVDRFSRVAQKRSRINLWTR